MLSTELVLIALGATAAFGLHHVAMPRLLSAGFQMPSGHEDPSRREFEAGDPALAVAFLFTIVAAFVGVIATYLLPISHPHLQALIIGALGFIGIKVLIEAKPYLSAPIMKGRIFPRVLLWITVLMMAAAVLLMLLGILEAVLL